MNVSTESFAIDFARLVDSQPDAVAVIVGGSLTPRTITYASLDNLIDRCIGEFAQRGLSPGDTVLALMPNSSEAFVAFLACIKGGYGFAPLPCTASRRELQTWIRLVKPGLCIATDLIADDAVAVLSENNVPVVRAGLGGEFDWLPSHSGKVVAATQSRIYLSTSGTTGDPKAMVLDGDRLWASGRAFMKFHRLQGSRLRFWNYLPMSYLGGLYNLGLIPLCVGGSTVIDESFSGRTFVQFWQTVERFEIDAVWFVPTIVRGLVKLAERMQIETLRNRSKRIRTAFLGTAPIDLATKRQFETMFGLTLLENFALSETTFLSSEVDGKLNRRVEGSVGEVLPYAESRFVPVAPGEAACVIHAKSPFLFLGYLSNDGSIDAPLDDDGFLPTGDLGHLNEDKQLVIDGRTRDIIKKAGNLVSLREAEVLAETHEAVHEAAGVPVSHDFYGESYVIFLILKSGHGEESLADISTFIHENLVKYKWPETLLWRADFPRTASGKVKKRMLADELAGRR
jgi:acyl-coenzyme A synthetase/AMP-(fatty) acid ligase